MVSFIHRLQRSPFVADFLALVNSRFITIGVGLLTSIITARVMGPEKRGDYAAILAVPTLLVPLGELGLRQSAIFFIGKKKLDNQSVISTLGLINLFTSFLVIISSFVIYLVLGHIATYGLILIAVAIVLIPPRFISSTFSGVIIGNGEIKKVAHGEILTQVSYLLLLCLFIIPQTTQVLGVVAAAGLPFVLQTIYILDLVRKYGRINVRYISGVPKQMLKTGFMYGITLFVLQLNYRLDIIILEQLTTAAEVGIYSVGVTIVEMLWILPMALTQVNHMHSAIARDSIEYARKTAQLLRVVLWLGALSGLLVFLFIPQLVVFIYGEDYRASADVVRMLLLGIWAGLIFKVLNSDLAGRGRPEVALKVYGLALTFNVIANIILIPHYGVMGAALSSTFSYSLGAILFAVVYARISNLKLSELFMLRKSDIQRLHP